jgi:hypothetical protein
MASSNGAGGGAVASAVDPTVSKVEDDDASSVNTDDVEYQENDICADSYYEELREKIDASKTLKTKIIPLKDLVSDVKKRTELWEKSVERSLYNTFDMMDGAPSYAYWDVKNFDKLEYAQSLFENVNLILKEDDPEKLKSLSLTYHELVTMTEHVDNVQHD